jgi:hypothetical protein
LDEDKTRSFFFVDIIQFKQDHQRWGYSTVTHLEQPVYLPTWKDLKKRKEKNTEKRLNQRSGEDGRAFPFFPSDLRAFGAQAVRLQTVFFPMLQASLTILESWTILDHFRPSWTILDHIGPS